MKKRTQVLACMYCLFAAVLFACQFAVVCSILLHRHEVSAAFWGMMLVSLLLFAMQGSFWYGLIMGRKWGWNGLMVLCTIMTFNFVAQAVWMFLHHSIAHSLAGYAAWLFLWVAFPAWILLTDKPSGWRDSDSRAQWHPTLNDIANRRQIRTPQAGCNCGPRFAASEIGFPPPPFRDFKRPDSSTEHI